MPVDKEQNSRSLLVLTGALKNGEAFAWKKEAVENIYQVAKERRSQSLLCKR